MPRALAISFCVVCAPRDCTQISCFSASQVAGRSLYSAPGSNVCKTFNVLSRFRCNTAFVKSHGLASAVCATFATTSGSVILYLPVAKTIFLISFIRATVSLPISSINL